MSRQFFLFIFVLGCLGQAQAVRLQDYTPFHYEVRFTNPQCATYKYDGSVVSEKGQSLVEKPKNVYCKASDAAANINRPGSPSEKLLEWISQPKTTEIFMTYLSFSNVEITKALCQAMTTRNVKVTIVQDSQQDHARLDELKVCGGANFVGLLRGHVPGIDFAHNKVFIVNPNSRDLDEIQISFGSGNLTSGIVLHHENWHFITTHRNTYFSQSHLCLMRAEIDHGSSGQDFQNAMKSCLALIPAVQEEDIQAFFVPGQGSQAWAAASEALARSTDVKLAAHRFSFNKMIAALSAKLQEGTGFKLKLLFDDDIYWVHQPNTGNEKKQVVLLESQGAKPHYLQTNHGSNLLHHNKFMVFNTPQGKAAFVGAGNFTGTAFTSNWENFYFVTIPSVVAQMDAQYDHLYDELSTPPQDMPTTDTLP